MMNEWDIDEDTRDWEELDLLERREELLGLAKKCEQFNTLTRLMMEYIQKSDPYFKMPHNDTIEEAIAFFERANKSLYPWLSSQIRENHPVRLIDERGKGR